MAKYLVTGRIFGAGGKLLDGKVVELDNEPEDNRFTKVSAAEAKKVESGQKLEVATPKKSEDKIDEK